MNINKMLKRFKTEIGLVGPLKTSMTDQELIDDILVPITLDTFSKYFRHKIHYDGIVFNEGMRIKSNIFKLPKEVIDDLIQLDIDIFSIREFFIDNSTDQLGNAYPEEFNNMRMFASDQGMFCGDTTIVEAAYANEYVNLASLKSIRVEIRNSRSIEFSRMIVFDKKYSFDMYTTHAPNFSTITMDYEEAFTKLAKLDLMRILYNNEFKYIDKVDTGFAAIDLRLEQFEQAEEKYQELLIEMKEQAIHNDPYITTV